MAARSLGQGAGGVLRRITLPLIRGSVGTALLLVFVDGVKELPATLLLRPFNYETLATRTMEMASLEQIGKAAPPAVLVIAGRAVGGGGAGAGQYGAASMMAQVVVVMGVSGAGKSTLARDLATALGARFLEGDEFHPPENVARMAAGQPLSDAMRWPWLAALARAAAAERDAGHDVVVACSALKASYRQALRDGAGPLRFLFLDGPRDVLVERMAARRGHYMPATLLDSQLATLEPPGPDEADAIRLPLSMAPGALLRQALAALERPGPDR